MNKLTLLIISLFLISAYTLTGQELTADSHTLLLLHFNGDPIGAGGEFPTFTSNLSYQAGLHGQGIYLGTGNFLEYAGAGNIDEQTGTVEFWMKPDWNGNDGLGHNFLEYGGFGGFRFLKDGGNWFTCLFNLFGGGGGQMMSVYGYVGGSWPAGEWRHIAVTWDSNNLSLYFDGQLVGQNTTTSPLPPISNANLRIGGNGTTEYAQAVVDEYRLSNVARSAAEIFNSFVAGQSPTSLDVEPATANMYPTWWQTPLVSLATTTGPIDVPPENLSWTSSNLAVADVDTDGKIKAFAAGTTVITGSYLGFSDAITVTVTDPVLAPVYETIDPFLSTPATGGVEEIPVVILRFLPTADGINVDVSKTPDYWSLNPLSLADLKANIDAYDRRVKFGLEEGSKFRGYSNPSAPPHISYRVVEYITIYEITPPGPIVNYANGHPVFLPDFHSIFERFDIENYVNNLGVKEIWMWDSGFDSGYPSYDPAIHDPENFRSNWESNMSSPTTGDISNSNRDNADLPVYNHTYVVYGQNFRRSQAEAVHNRGHQYEHMLSHVNWLQDGNSDLFWKKFAGQDASGVPVTGRCGWTHMPPNTTVDYDYLNPAIVSSDIEDWKPDGGGQTTMVSVDTWANQNYAWPGASVFSQKTESQFYLYWMQSFPGLGNHIPYGSYVLSNWWEFIADWDQSINNGLGLYESPLVVSPVVFLQGAYDSATGLMRDDLRANALLPFNEPYTALGYPHVGGGGESRLGPSFDVGGQDAIVDWVLVELRDASDASVVVATRSALLQRDGDVVDVDGVSPVAFIGVPAGDYYLAVNHRTHLGVMSAVPFAFSNIPAVVDFTSDFNSTFGGINGIADLGDGNLGLFSGDFSQNGQVQNTDYSFLVPTLGTSGYVQGDLDLNGQVQNTDLQLQLLPNIGRGQAFP